MTLILATLDRIKDLLDDLEQHRREQEGSDRDLIGALDRLAGAAPASEPAGPSSPRRRSAPTAPMASGKTITRPRAG